jgi:hypothetical protein
MSEALNCGPLAERFGAVRVVVLTELLTGLAILTLLPLPLTASQDWDGR